MKLEQEDRLCLLVQTQAKERHVEGLVSLVVLEQFIAQLPQRTAEWDYTEAVHPAG